jgi:hypothetical protein
MLGLAGSVVSSPDLPGVGEGLSYAADLARANPACSTRMLNLHWQRACIPVTAFAKGGCEGKTHVEYATLAAVRVSGMWRPMAKRMKGSISARRRSWGGLIYGAVVFAPGARSGLACPAEAG